jgi:hypothetical protein
MTTIDILETDVSPLVDAIERMVERRTGGRIWNLRVEIEYGRIVLLGRAGSYYAKQLAQHAAMEAANFSESSPSEIWNEIVVLGR